MPDGPNNRNDWTARDRWNSLVVKTLTPITGWALMGLVGLAAFYVKTSFSEVKDQVALVSVESKETAKETAVLKEAVSTMKGAIQEIKEGQKAVEEKLDRLIEKLPSRPR